MHRSKNFQLPISEEIRRASQQMDLARRKSTILQEMGLPRKESLLLQVADPVRRQSLILQELGPHLERTLVRRESARFVDKLYAFYGVFLAFLAGASTSLTSVFVKKMNTIHPSQLCLYRFLSILICSLPPAVSSKAPLPGPPKAVFAILIYSALNTANFLLQYVSYQLMPLGEATVIIYSVPVFVTVAARIFLKESCGVFQSITLLMAVTGILFTAKVPSQLSHQTVSYTPAHIYGIVAAVSSLLFNTGTFIILRKLRNVHRSVVLVNYGVMATTMAIIFTASIQRFSWNQCGYGNTYTIALCVVSFLSNHFLTMAMQHELAGPVTTVLSAANIFFSFIWQILLFNEIADTYSLTGAFLVGFSVIFVCLRSWLASLPPESKRLKYLHFLLK